VGFFSTRRRRLDGEELARQLRAQARRLRRRLTEVAEDAHLQWTFRVARGAIAKELLAASTDVDMVILGRSGWSIVRRRRLGSTARAVVFGAPALTLLLQDGTCLGLPVMVVYDGSQMAQRALVAAAVLARAQKGSVTVALVDGREEGEELRRRAAAQLKPHEIQARYRLLTHANVNKLVQRVTGEGCGTLVLPLKTELLHEEALVELLDEIDIPTLFVR